jgi:mannan endo-1,4-beta-mannosidase
VVLVGVPHAKRDELQRLWRYTVTYLRDVKGLHDVLGYDYYFPSGPARAEQLAGVTRDLAWVVRQAESRGRIPGLTESGLTGLRDSTFTKRLAAAIEGDSLSRRLAYVTVWRNANRGSRNDQHIHAPYAGHPSAEDFRRFKADPLFLFEDALPDLYRTSSR